MCMYVCRVKVLVDQGDGYLNKPETALVNEKVLNLILERERIGGKCWGKKSLGKGNGESLRKELNDNPKD